MTAELEGIWKDTHCLINVLAAMKIALLPAKIQTEHVLNTKGTELPLGQPVQSFESNVSVLSTEGQEYEHLELACVLFPF